MLIVQVSVTGCGPGWSRAGPGHAAAVAVILAEPGSEELAARLEDALVRLMPATTRVELGILIEARPWPAGQNVVERFLRDAKLDVVPVDADLADRAMSTWRRYRKGRQPAGPNLGDCSGGSRTGEAGRR